MHHNVHTSQHTFTTTHTNAYTTITKYTPQHTHTSYTHTYHTHTHFNIHSSQHTPKRTHAYTHTVETCQPKKARSVATASKHMHMLEGITTADTRHGRQGQQAPSPTNNTEGRQDERAPVAAWHVATPPRCAVCPFAPPSLRFQTHPGAPAPSPPVSCPRVATQATAWWRQGPLQELLPLWTASSTILKERTLTQQTRDYRHSSTQAHQWVQQTHMCTRTRACWHTRGEDRAPIPPPSHRKAHTGVQRGTHAQITPACTRTQTHTNAYVHTHTCNIQPYTLTPTGAEAHSMKDGAKHPQDLHPPKKQQHHAPTQKQHKQQQQQQQQNGGDSQQP